MRKTRQGLSLADSACRRHRAAVFAREGRLIGGDVLPGCFVRTTAEVLIAWLDGWAFARAADALTGYAELVVRREP